MTPRAGQTGLVTNGIKNGVRTRLWRDGLVDVENFPIEDVSDHLQEEGALVWLDLCDPDHELLLKLADELTLDSHAVEDAISSGERPKATRHATHTFVTVSSLAFRGDDVRSVGDTWVGPSPCVSARSQVTR